MTVKPSALVSDDMKSKIYKYKLWLDSYVIHSMKFKEILEVHLNFTMHT